MRRKNIRLVVVGDELVGKSSLINTIYSEVSSEVEKTLRKVILPPEMCLYSKEIFTELIDTSCEMDLTAEIKQADLVLLVYDVSEAETIDRIQTEWLPRICAAKEKIPIILVGNKMDKKQLQYENEDGGEYVKVKDVLRKVVRRYKNVQMGIECSAFYDRNVKSVLNCAQRAVLYPLSPLYSLQARTLTQDFQKALTRIFRIIDSDLDGKLYDSQMNTLQERVFQSELNLQDIKQIKDIIIKQLESEQQDYIQLPGFLALQKKCIEMLKIQICWSILRYFGYNDQLRIQINPDHIIPQELFGDTPQLTHDTLDFLINLYSLSKRQVTKKMSEQDEQENQYHSSVMQKIFQSSPEVTFPEFQDRKQLPQDQFILAWSMYAMVDYKQCYKSLLYLGCEKSMDETFVKKRGKNSYKDFQKLKQNKVVSVVVVDSPSTQNYVDTLFADCQKVESEEGLVYCRKSVLFSSKNSSKTYLLFRVARQNVREFFNEHRTDFFKKIDLMIHFETGHKQIRDQIPENMLLRSLSTREAEQTLQTDKPPHLNFDSIPVQYKQGSHNKFFELIQDSLQQIETALPAWKVQKLKKDNKKQKQLLLYSFVGLSSVALFVGGLLYKGKIVNPWK